jgi:catechol 2,3-dioxygenase-like lactoylglutathione lyase family enzyme
MPESSTFTLTRIGQISVNAKDLDRAVEFYREKLALKHLFTVPKMVFFDCGGIRLMLVCCPLII